MAEGGRGKQLYLMTDRKQRVKARVRAFKGTPPSTKPHLLLPDIFQQEHHKRKSSRDCSSDLVGAPERQSLPEGLSVDNQTVV